MNIQLTNLISNYNNWNKSDIPDVIKVTPVSCGDDNSYYDEEDIEGTDDNGTTYIKSCTPCSPCNPDSHGSCMPCTPCMPDAQGLCLPCHPCWPVACHPIVD